MSPNSDTRMLLPGENCWRIERCNRAALIVDAADYFRFARDAMLQAKQQILMIGWDFDTRITLDHSPDEGPKQLGPFLSWLPDKKEGLQVYLLKWDIGAIKLLGRGTTLLRLARWAFDSSISFKLDGAHPTGASHHHKIVVLDDQLAFCGGIDMTADRWDTSEHLECDDRRRRPTTRRRYGPWHDATMAVDGDAAKALGELARKRWELAGGAPIEPPSTGSPIWPKELSPTFRDVRVAISRTRGAYGEDDAVREIEQLFLDQIGRAKRFVYIESQYLASRAITEAIARRLAEPDGPEFVVVNPKSAEGWLEEEAMSTARAKQLELIEKADRHGRFRLYTPVTEGGKDIYVHSKILIVDDELIRVGSANLNNRSMCLDSECDLTVDSRLEGNEDVRQKIPRIRESLLAEHLGVSSDTVRAEFERSKSLIATVEALRGPSRSLVPFVAEEPDAFGKTLAESELLDPESEESAFEPITRRGMFGRIRRKLHA